eukprot:CAMPEP_0119379564 /NCGR_PEP_ID=MMETSP1334-20130426/53308_1 /TAXON_ID=127549 /ORGANISM="Calcidiscus leptoporus, Strain RCC1130" /LENGTH=369 /DNA_ID=CAMNT_0007399123 /DNA_START=164 /DNA_END=1273 /DNA_ORIENTATION=+
MPPTYHLTASISLALALGLVVYMLRRRASRVLRFIRPCDWDALCRLGPHQQNRSSLMDLALASPPTQSSPGRPREGVSYLRVGLIDRAAFVSRLQESERDGQPTLVLAGHADVALAAATFIVEHKLLRGGSCAAHIEELLPAAARSVQRYEALALLLEAAARAGCYKAILDAPPYAAAPLAKLGFVPSQATLTAVFGTPSIGGQPISPRLDQVEPRSLVEPADGQAGFVLRPLHASDSAAEVLPLLAQLSETVPMSQSRFTEQLLKMQGRLQVPLVVERCDGKLVGCITVLLQRQLLRDDELVAHLEDVVVDAGLRGSGIGRKLVLAAVRLAQEQGCSRAVLNCKEHNIPFYSKCGFDRCDLMCFARYL